MKILSKLRGACWPAGVLALLAFLSVGCSSPTPVGVSRLGVRRAYLQINESELNADRYSAYTQAVLHRYALESGAEKNPAQCVIDLHAIACRDERRDNLFALSEVCFGLGKSGRRYRVSGSRLTSKNFYGAAAAYAYFYLLGEGEEASPGPFDRRFRLACDIYNRSLSHALLERSGASFRGGDLPLPVGNLAITSGVCELSYPMSEYDRIDPSDEFLVRGLSVRNRTGGLGAPLVCSRKRPAGQPVGAVSSATLFVRFDGSFKDLGVRDCRTWLDIYSPLVHSSAEVGGRTVPLETDTTTQLAYLLDNPVLWRLGFEMFRLGEMPFPSDIYPVHPYQKGKIPVVLVHGTMSSPVWWAELINTLSADPVLRENIQVWLYLYDSGKPICISARNLRDSLERMIRRCDPEGQDPALKNMVAIGHSQGGLLVRLVTTDTDDAILRKATGKSLAELGVNKKDRALLERFAVFHAMPEIRRAVFISTPHRGSFLAGSMARKLTSAFIRLPKEAIKSWNDLVAVSERIKLPNLLKRNTPTSIDSMAPDNPFLEALVGLPFPPGVMAHSIIPVKKGESPPDGDDGVVKYTSAHLEGVASEFVVSDVHSCQGNPLVIEEVRRILLTHLRENKVQ